jgi:hypothetical protein
VLETQSGVAPKCHLSKGLLSFLKAVIQKKLLLSFGIVRCLGFKGDAHKLPKIKRRPGFRLVLSVAKIFLAVFSL